MSAKSWRRKSGGLGLGAGLTTPDLRFKAEVFWDFAAGALYYRHTMERNLPFDSSSFRESVRGGNGDPQNNRSSRSGDGACVRPASTGARKALYAGSDQQHGARRIRRRFGREVGGTAGY